MFDSSELEEVGKGGGTFPSGFGYDSPIRMIPAEQLPEIALTLLRRGYGLPNLAKIFGGNFLRVAEEVWKP